MEKKFIKAFFLSILVLLLFNVLNWYSEAIFVNDKAIKLEEAESYVQNWVKNIDEEEGVFLGRVPKVGTSDQYYLYINKQNNTYLDGSQYSMTNINSGFMVRIYNDTATDNVNGVVYKLTLNKKINYILVKDEFSTEKIASADIPILEKLPFYEKVRALVVNLGGLIIRSTLMALIFVKLDR